LSLIILIAKLAEKLDDAVSQANAKPLIVYKYHKFLEILAILFIQYLN
jgi:hypothetical protein